MSDRQTQADGILVLANQFLNLAIRAVIANLDEDTLRLLAQTLLPYQPPERPGAIHLSVTAEVLTPMDPEKFTVTCSLPNIPSPDVVSRELLVAVNGIDNATLTLSHDESSRVLGDFEAGTAITATLVYIDAAGNRSAPRTEDLTVVDTIPPPQPDVFGLSVTAQVDPTAPPVVPPVTPVDPTVPPVDPTVPPVAPVDPTVPVDPSVPPVAPVDPTVPVVDPAAPPVDPTVPVVVTPDPVPQPAPVEPNPANPAPVDPSGPPPA